MRTGYIKKRPLVFRGFSTLIPRIIAIGIFVFFSSSLLTGEGNVLKWKSISGRWENRRDDKDSYIIETRSKTWRIGYSELTNYNSIITEKPIIGYSTIRFSMRIKDPVRSPVESMSFFAVENFKNFYAFKFVGGMNKIERVLFIKSKIIDIKKASSKKWNFDITELFSKNYELDYKKGYIIKIRVDKKKVRLFINGEKVLDVETDGDLSNGRFGFSNRNAMLRIDDVKVLNGGGIIFHDDFSKDSIMRKRFKASVKDRRGGIKKNMTNQDHSLTR